mgnify:CR=1 FL=1
MAPGAYKYIKYSTDRRIWIAHKEFPGGPHDPADVEKHTISRLKSGERTKHVWKGRSRVHEGIVLDVHKIVTYAESAPNGRMANWHPLLHIKAYSWEAAVGLSGLLSGFVVGLSFYADRQFDLPDGVQDTVVGFVAMGVHVLGFCIMALFFGYGSSSMAPLPQIICDQNIFDDAEAPSPEHYFVITVSNCDIYPHVRPISGAWAWVGARAREQEAKKKAPGTWVRLEAGAQAQGTPVKAAPPVTVDASGTGDGAAPAALAAAPLVWL